MLAPARCCVALYVAAGAAAAHDAQVVHPAITDNAIDLLDLPLITRFREEIRQGAIDEDGGGRSCGHAYNPKTGQGYPAPTGCGTAIEKAQDLWDRSLAAYRIGRHTGANGAFRLLGRTLHILQDVNCPAHVHSDVHAEGDDFESWAVSHFQKLSDLDPFLPGDGSIEDTIKFAANATYELSTFAGEIIASDPQPESTLKKMFPGLVYVPPGEDATTDPHWAIADLGTFDHLVLPDGWFPSPGDFTDDQSGPDGVRRLAGGFYLKNAAGDKGDLTPAVWNGEANTKTLLDRYGEALFPQAVRLSAGLLERFSETVCTPPAPDFKADQEKGCAPLAVQFTEMTAGEFLTAFQWDFGDGRTSPERNPRHEYAAAGKYAVQLTVTSDCGKKTENKDGFIEVLPSGSVDFTASPTSGCAALTVEFTAETSGEEFDAFSWDFGDGATSGEKNPRHAYGRPGIYSVVLTATGACEAKSRKKDGLITVLGRPTAGFTRQPSEGCAPLEVAFTDASEGSGLTWKWDFGDGASSAEQNPRHTYDEPGLYSVSLMVRNSCGATEKALPEAVRVLAPITADFSGTPVSGCAPLTVSFRDQSAGEDLDSWQWDFGDGSSSRERSPGHVYRSPGKYSVRLTVKGACGEKTKRRTDHITVLKPSTARFRAQPSSSCAPYTVKFTDESTGDGLEAWAWDFGDGASSRERNPTHKYLKKGRYRVTLKVSGDCGRDVASSPFEIDVPGPPSEPDSVRYLFSDPKAVYVQDMVLIQWPAVEDAEEYAVEARVTGKTDWIEVARAGTEEARHRLDDAGTWTFRVTAENGCGESDPVEGPPLVVTPAPIIAHWPLDCAAGAATSAIAEDSERGNDGRAAGTVGCGADKTGRVGKALRFNEDGSIQGTLPVLRGDFSLGFWFSPAGEGPQAGTLVAVGESQGGGDALAVSWSPEGNELGLKERGGARAIEIGGLLADTWHHVLVTRKGSALTLYVDGIESGGRTDPASLGSVFAFGGGPPGFAYAGKLDEVRYESRSRSAEEAIDLILLEKGTLYLHPGSDVGTTLNPGRDHDVLRARLRTSTAGGGTQVLKGFRFEIEDVTPGDSPGAGPPAFAHLEDGVLSYVPGCIGLERIELGSVRLTPIAAPPLPPPGDTAARVRCEVTIDPPFSFPDETDGCLTATFRIANEAPPGGAIRVRVGSPDDVIVEVEGGKAFVAGRRILGTPAVEGEPLAFVLAAPALIRLSVAEGIPGTVPAESPVTGAELHRAVISLADPGELPEELRLRGITYHAVEGTEVDGLQNVVLFADRNANGAAEADETLGTGSIDGTSRSVRFQDLDLPIEPQGDMLLIVKGDLEPPRRGAVVMLRPPRVPGALTAGAWLLAALLVASSLLFAGRGKGRPAPALAVASACVLLVSLGLGCGGGGGGGGQRPAAFQLAITRGESLDVRGAESDSRAAVDLSAGAIRGPRYEVAQPRA